MKITLKASRDQATAGSNFGITATIENVSKSPIYILPASMALTVPPELDAAGPRDLYGFIPGVQAPKGHDYWSTVVVLEPGAVVSIFWTSGNAGTSGSSTSDTQFCAYVGLDCASFLRFISFYPGRYTLSVVAAYWDTYEGAEQKNVERHMQTAEIQEVITAPQSVILWGAILGGIIAFSLLHAPDAASTTRPALLRAWVFGLFSSALLSVIVTIMLARLSQSQFLISVAVNDFWGAIAVGFLITAAGPSVLQKFTSLVGTSQAQGPQVSSNVPTQPVSTTSQSSVVAPAVATTQQAPITTHTPPTSTQAAPISQTSSAPTQSTPATTSQAQGPQVSSSVPTQPVSTTSQSSLVPPAVATTQPAPITTPTPPTSPHAAPISQTGSAPTQSTPATTQSVTNQPATTTVPSTPTAPAQNGGPPVPPNGSGTHAASQQAEKPMVDETNGDKRADESGSAGD